MTRPPSVDQQRKQSGQSEPCLSIRLSAEKQTLSLTKKSNQPSTRTSSASADHGNRRSPIAERISPVSSSSSNDKDDYAASGTLSPLGSSPGDKRKTISNWKSDNGITGDEPCLQEIRKVFFAALARDPTQSGSVFTAVWNGFISKLERTTLQVRLNVATVATPQKSFTPPKTHFEETAIFSLCLVIILSFYPSARHARALGVVAIAVGASKAQRCAMTAVADSMVRCAGRRSCGTPRGEVLEPLHYRRGGVPGHQSGGGVVRLRGGILNWKRRPLPHARTGVQCHCQGLRPGAQGLSQGSREGARKVPRCRLRHYGESRLGPRGGLCGSLFSVC